MPLNPQPLLRGEKIRLTALTEDDLPTLSRWYDDTDFARHFDSTPAAPRQFTSDFLDEIRKSHTDFTFAIRTLNAPEIIGITGVDGILWNHQVGHVGIGIGEAANRGCGYGREAMQLLTRFAFDELNLRRLSLTVFSYNTAAIALYTSLGWVREGVYREFLIRDREPHDMLLYGLLAREWRTSASG